MVAKFYHKKLKNGMNVVFEKRPGTGVVSVVFAVKYGGINESLEEKGISHFIEHLLYKGTKKRNTKQISEEIEKKGGVLNGFTSEQMTAYWAKLPSKHLGMALDVLSDIIQNPLFDEKEIEKERQVIMEEMKLWRDTPQLHVHDKIMSYLYGGTLGKSLIGTPKSLSSLTPKKLRENFKEIYTTENLVLCVVGDCDFKRLCDFCEKNFLKTKSKIPKQKIILHHKKGIEKRKGIDQANLILAYHVPKATEKGHYTAQVLNALMAGGMSSRLFTEIREKRNLAYSVKGNCNSDKDFGYNSIFVGTTKKNVGLVRRLILKEFEKLKDLSERELNEIKEQLVGNNKISKEDSQGQMLELLYGELFGDVKGVYEYEKRIKQVKLSDVKKLANFKNYSFFALVPK